MRMTQQDTREWLASVSTAITAVAAVVALVFAIVEVRGAREEFAAHQAAGRTQHMEQLYQSWSSPPMLAYRAIASERYPADSPQLVEIFAFFERLAYAKKNGVVSSEDLEYYFLDAMLAYWCTWEPWVRQYRVDNGQDAEKGDIWRGFEDEIVIIRRKYKMSCPPAKALQHAMANERQRFAELQALPKKTNTERPVPTSR